MRLSNSSTNTLKDCGYYYKLYYIDKLRPLTTKSALFFGNAMDNALNDLLASKLKDNPQILDYKKTFKDTLTNININGQIYNAKTCGLIQYNKSDLDMTLLTEEDLQELKDYFKLENEEPLTKKEEIDYVTWLSLYRKGLILIDSYVENILSKIEYVSSIQESVSLKNDQGDELVGVIDAVVKFKDDDKLYIADNKTSSLPYKQEDLTYSKQLATYAEYKNIPNVAYLVIEKKLRKTHPITRTQILKGTLTEEHISKTFVDYENSLEQIKNNEFAKNHEKCYNFYGNKCPYFNYCKYNNTNGLIKLEDKKDET